MTTQADVCIAVCDYLQPEVAAVLAGGELPGTTVRTLGRDCFGHAGPARRRAERLAAICEEFPAVDVIGGTCLRALESQTPPSSTCRFHIQEPTCLPLIDREVAAGLISEGAHLITPGWLEQWEKNIGDWGFEQSTAREMFHESCKEIVLIDSGVIPDAPQKLAALAAWLDLPARRVTVGLDLFRSLLARLVMERRLATFRRDAEMCHQTGERRVAELGMALDLIGQLTQSVREDEVIKRVLDLFSMLFGASRVVVASVEHGEPTTLASTPLEVSLDRSTLANLLDSGRAYAWNEAEDGFVAEIDSGGGATTVVEASGFAFPEYRERYLELALPVLKVCALALANARTYRRLHEAQEALSATTDELRGVLSALPDVIAIVDTAGVVVDVKAGRLEPAVGATDGIVGRRLFEFLGPKAATVVAASLRASVATGTLEFAEYELARQDDTAHFEARFAPMANDQVVVVIRDVTERHGMVETIRGLSVTDELTGLLNRRGFIDLAERQLRAAARSGNREWLVFADLDGLKAINDRLGHDFGDLAIQEAAALLESSFRSSDIVARLGGDEFAILATEISPTDGDTFVTRIEGGVRGANAAGKREYPLSISIGLTLFDPSQPETLDELLRSADACMYANKRARRASRLTDP